MRLKLAWAECIAPGGFAVVEVSIGPGAAAVRTTKSTGKLIESCVEIGRWYGSKKFKLTMFSVLGSSSTKFSKSAAFDFIQDFISGCLVFGNPLTFSVAMDRGVPEASIAPLFVKQTITC